MNNVVLIGRLTANPETKQVGGHTKCCFTIAVNRSSEKADFIPIVAWDKTAEVSAKYLSKGAKCAIAGRINVESYKGTDGTNKTYTCVVAYALEFMSAKSDTCQPDPERIFN